MIDYIRQRRDCLRQLAELFHRLIGGIGPDDRADEEADSPSLSVAVGFTFTDRGIRYWWETGDNFSSPASHPHWVILQGRITATHGEDYLAVVTLTPESNPWQCAREALEEAEELASH